MSRDDLSGGAIAAGLGSVVGLLILFCTLTHFVESMLMIKFSNIIWDIVASIAVIMGGFIAGVKAKGSETINSAAVGMALILFCILCLFLVSFVNKTYSVDLKSVLRLAILFLLPLTGGMLRKYTKKVSAQSGGNV